MISMVSFSLICKGAFAHRSKNCTARYSIPNKFRKVTLRASETSLLYQVGESTVFGGHWTPTSKAVRHRTTELLLSLLSSYSRVAVLLNIVYLIH